MARVGQKDLCRKLVIKSVAELSKMVAVGKSMNDIQTIFAADLIIEKFGQLTVEDLYLCFKNGIASEYGPMFDRLDANVICDWLKKYFEDRNTFAEMEQMKKHNEVKKEVFVSTPENQEVFEKGIKMVLDALPKPEEPKYVTRTHEITPLQKLVSRWADQFDVLYNYTFDLAPEKRFSLSCKAYHGIRVLFFNGMAYEKSNFITYKQNQNEEKVIQASLKQK